MKILSMSGFVPEQICDTIRFTGYSGERSISHFCGYANDYISQVLNSDDIDGAVFPKSCDSSRIIKSYLEDSAKFVYQINVPARNDDLAIDFYANELRLYRAALEQKNEIALENLRERTEKVNERNMLIGKHYANLENISYTDYLSAIHHDMQIPLLSSEDKRLTGEFKQKNEYGHRVFLVGSFLCNCHIVDVIESNGMGIVGDNLPESGRIQGRVVDENAGDLFREISEDILDRRMSPTQNNFGQILDKDINEIKRVKAEGVIFVTQKYCESYDYLFSVYKRRLDKEKIPIIQISLLNSQDEKKVEMSLEAFSDSL